MIMFYVCAFCAIVLPLAALDCECSKCNIEKLPDGCTSIKGHLSLTFEAEMPPLQLVARKLGNVTKVVGCLTVLNTAYTSLSVFSNLETIIFSNKTSSCVRYGMSLAITGNNLLRSLAMPRLKKITSSATDAPFGVYMTQNPSLCITEEELNMFLQTPDLFMPHFDICNSTKVYCRRDDLHTFNDTNLPANCDVLTDGLVLNHTAPSTELQYRLNTIEQIIGFVWAINTSLSAVAFPKLWRVYNTMPAIPVLLFQDNSQLASVSFPMLQSILYIGQTKTSMYAEKCPKITVDGETCSQLSTLGIVLLNNKACVPAAAISTTPSPASETGRTNADITKGDNDGDKEKLHQPQNKPKSADGNNIGCIYVFFFAARLLTSVLGLLFP